MLRICHVIFAAQVLLMAGCAASGVADKALTKSKTADCIVIEKSAHTMKLMSGSQELKTYKVALGDPKGTKQQEGDRKTPEGEYVIDSKNEHSRFHRALHISYPNAADRKHAKKLAVSPGGDVEIHGLPSVLAWVGSLHRVRDWTAGCVAVTNSEIDEIWPLVPVGTKVEIRP
jgi:murein L,D-transpeptidase YafK